MEPLFNPQSSYVLRVDATALHQETKSWLQEIKFWEDELAFLYKLLHIKLSNNASPGEEYAGLDRDPMTLNSDILDAFKNKVQEHERFLISILQTTSGQDEKGYRMKHLNLREEMIAMYPVIRSIKQGVSALIKEREIK